MAVASQKLGPGTLKFNTGADDFSAQVTGCKVNPSESVATTDAVDVLSGDQIAAKDTVTYEYTISGTFIGDLTALGVIDWSWTNAGVEQDFEFIPNTAAARKVTGTCRVIPLAIGGDEIKARPTSDFEWKIIGTPVFDAV